MTSLPSLPRILLIDSNVYFAKRLGDALQQQGFEIIPCAQSAYALTMLEWNTPAAIICATNLREMGAFEMAPILRADPKTAGIPLIAVGGGGDQNLFEALRAGCDDYMDRRRPPAGARRAHPEFSHQPSGRFSANADALHCGDGPQRQPLPPRFAWSDSDARAIPSNRRVAHQRG